jgi:diketogulonate reductase-like aldo/keto reductase
MYDSEKACGEAFRLSGIPREEIFITTKVRKAGYKETKKAVEKSLEETGLDYIDLYLNHSPYGGPEARKGTWKALVEAKQEGKIRSIGVSNYGVHHLEETLAYIKELEGELGEGNAGEISVGQWELHPWLAHPDIVEWCYKYGVVIEAYCPIAKGQRFDEPQVQALTKKYGKTGAQILLRWSLQKVCGCYLLRHNLRFVVKILTTLFRALFLYLRVKHHLESRLIPSSTILN